MLLSSALHVFVVRNAYNCEMNVCEKESVMLLVCVCLFEYLRLCSMPVCCLIFCISFCLSGYLSLVRDGNLSALAGIPAFLWFLESILEISSEFGKKCIGVHVPYNRELQTPCTPAAILFVLSWLGGVLFGNDIVSCAYVCFMEACKWDCGRQAMHEKTCVVGSLWCGPGSVGMYETCPNGSNPVEASVFTPTVVCLKMFRRLTKEKSALAREIDNGKKWKIVGT